MRQAKTIALALCGISYSKWIDEGHVLPTIETNNGSFSPLAQNWIKSFDQYRCYSQSFELEAPNLLAGKAKLQLFIFLGFKGNGVFPGSRVGLASEDLSTHAVLEAWRHLEIFNRLNQNPKKLQENLQPPFDRIYYFGKNSHSALEQIAAATKEDWPQPELRWLKSIPVPSGAPYFVY